LPSSLIHAKTHRAWLLLQVLLGTLLLVRKNSLTQQMWLLGQDQPAGIWSIIFLSMSNVLEPPSNSHCKNASTQEFESDWMIWIWDLLLKCLLFRFKDSTDWWKISRQAPLLWYCWDLDSMEKILKLCSQIWFTDLFCAAHTWCRVCIHHESDREKQCV
jgi:hypothetical protein